MCGLPRSRRDYPDDFLSRDCLTEKSTQWSDNLQERVLKPGSESAWLVLHFLLPQLKVYVFYCLCCWVPEIRSVVNTSFRDFEVFSYKKQQLSNKGIHLFIQATRLL